MRYHQWQRLRLTLFSCYEGAVAGKREISRLVDYHSAWLVLEGTAEVEGGGRVARAGPGEWLCAGPGPRRQRFSGEARLLSVLFLASWPSGRPLFPHGLPLAFPGSECPGLAELGRAIDREIEQQHPTHDFYVFNEETSLETYLQIQRGLPEFLLELSGALRRRGVIAAGEKELDPRIERVLEMVNALPPDGAFSNASLAARAGLSPAQLQRLFARQIGRTPKEHFDHRRLIFAENRLIQPGTQIKEVAYALGFQTQGHFTRWFHRFHRVSPRAFQEQHGA